MKYLKLFALAAVAAAALMAFVGAGTASAETTACKAAEGGECYGVGTEIEEVSIEGAEGIKNATLTTGGGFVSVHCDSTVKGKIETATTPSGKGEASWSNCTGADEVKTVTNGTITLHHQQIGETTHGLVTIKDFDVTVRFGSTTCIYGGEITGTLTPSATDPVVHITANVKKTNTAPHTSSFFCPSESIWHATYTVKKPSTGFFPQTGV